MARQTFFQENDATLKVGQWTVESIYTQIEDMKVMIALDVNVVGSPPLIESRWRNQRIHED